MPNPNPFTIQIHSDPTFEHQSKRHCRAMLQTITTHPGLSHGQWLESCAEFDLEARRDAIFSLVLMKCVARQPAGEPTGQYRITAEGNSLLERLNLELGQHVKADAQSASNEKTPVRA